MLLISLLMSWRHSTNTFSKVAVMANSVSTNMQSAIDIYPGCEPVICPIVITNKDQNRVCEVAQEFVIEVKRYTAENIPLVIGLYSDQLCTEIIGIDETGVYSSEKFKFKANVEETKTYYLKIEWPEEENNENLSLEIETLSINVIASQID